MYLLDTNICIYFLKGQYELDKKINFDLYAKEKARLRKHGILISEFDLLIGCTSIVYNFKLITKNTKHFERIDNISIEDWTNTSFK